MVDHAFECPHEHIAADAQRRDLLVAVEDRLDDPQRRELLRRLPFQREIVGMHAELVDRAVVERLRMQLREPSLARAALVVAPSVHFDLRGVRRLAREL